MALTLIPSRRYLARSFLLTAASLLFLVACNFPAENAVDLANQAATKTPFQPQSDAANLEGSTGEEGDSAIRGNLAWWISPDLPAAVRQQIEIPEDAEEAENQDEADISILAGEGQIVGHWVYALVTPFPTLKDEVTIEEVRRAWRGRPGGPFDGAPLMMTAETEALFSSWWGEPAADALEIYPPEDLLDAAWAAQPSWAIVPFEALEPKWKVLAVDDQSPLWKGFDPADYELGVPIGVLSAGELPSIQLVSNRDAQKLTTVIITGVTALVRATAWEMERKGITYPAEDIGDLLSEADITHISNEVPFAEDCPPPNPGQRSMIFCSDARYIELLEVLGTDVVELSGDHFNDWTKDAMLFTLDLYKERDWSYYGGGENIDEGRQALLLEHNGNQIAFIGCNGKGGGYASADVDYPGAVTCDYAWLTSEINRLSQDGFIVIATFQHDEVYTYKPQPGLIRDFGLAAEAGASIVSGSQAHQAHGMEFKDDDTLIMYGLGNLFFDQIVISQDTSQALIARHLLYDGRYISTELFTTIFVDYAKPRFMTTEERSVYLAQIFKASIWEESE